VERAKAIARVIGIIILLFLIYCLLTTFNDSFIRASLEYDGSHEIYLFESSFWGLKTTQRNVKFFAESYDMVEGWYAKDDDGEWSIRIMLDFEDRGFLPQD